MGKSNITYCDKVWNPVTGCEADIHNAGCYERCWARAMAKRSPAAFGGDFSVRTHPGRLEEPMGWKTPQVVFICSLGDLFHASVDPAFRQNVMQVIRMTLRHQYLLLTKRAAEMAFSLAGGMVPENVWAGVTCMTQSDVDERLPVLAGIRGVKRWLSLEPLLGPVVIPQDLLRQLSAVVVGCESGAKRRPMAWEWEANISRLLAEADIPHYTKQWGEHEDGTGEVVHNHPWADAPWREASI